MKTKTLLSFIIAMTVMTINSVAQQESAGKNEVRLGYGVVTGPEVANALFSIWGTVGYSIMKDTIVDYTCSMYGIPTLEYNRKLNPWLSIGASLSVNPINTFMRGKSGVEFTFTYYQVPIMARIDFHYFNKGLVSMYSGLQGGGNLLIFQDRKGFSTVTDTGFGVAWHVNAFGIRIGKTIGAYMEWGVGYRGIVNFGISGQF